MSVSAMLIIDARSFIYDPGKQARHLAVIFPNYLSVIIIFEKVRARVGWILFFCFTQALESSNAQQIS
jgi:hypothetical protein